ncbi:ABC transporter substrate-binding protein [Butyrivibrio sp. JL13D10]|uniref:ABC transporter substrate-binding protein n=1 Tax=Butyrivibrio sp. JL13D10 TaxID=3236815 RepID=UPI0038B66ED6
MKKNLQKVMSLLCVSAMSLSMIAGCGGGNNGGTTTTETPAATEEASTEAPAAEETTEEATEEATETTEEATEEAGDETAEATETTADGDSTPRNETLYEAGQQWGTINDWNPMSANSNNGLALSANDVARELVYETLFMFNPLDGKLYPLLGSEYNWNDDQTELTIKLNPDAKWSDGSAFTAEDVAYTYATHVKYQSSQGSDFSTYIDAVEASDDTTVVVKAKVADGKAVNPLKVTSILNTMYMMQKAYLQTVEERNGEDADKVKQDTMEDLVHTGPYAPYISNDQKAVLQRDDNYWGQAASMWGKLPVPKYIAHTIYKDNAAGQVALSQGEVDVCQQFITDVQNMWLEDDLPISTWLDEAPYGQCEAIPSMFFNVEREGLDQKEVRRAIAMAVDYEQIIASAMSGQSPTFDEYPRSVVGPTDGERKYVDFDAIADLQWKNADVDGANKLLDDAGIVDGDGDGIREYNGKNLSFKAECPTGWSDWNASMEIVAAAGEKIGIDIQTYFPEASSFYDDMTTCNFDICMWSAPGAGVMNPYSKGMFYFSEEYAKLASNWSGNFGHYMNDDAEAILEAIPTETDEAKLKEYYTELSRILLEECPAVALMYRPQLFYAVNESVWTNFPAADDGRNIPPTDCTDGYGIAALYDLELVE